MADKCLRYHSRLAGLLYAKKRELRHSHIMAQGESVLCNFAERAPMPKGIEKPRRRNLDIKHRDLEIEKGPAGLP